MNKIRISKEKEKDNLDDKKDIKNERTKNISLNSTDAESSIKIKNQKRKCCWIYKKLKIYCYYHILLDKI